ncbi:23S rRNA (guanosine(2251)-2'-O)-methyltransferase RlmB [Halomonas sp. McH1-25]|uniref:23S rRNA (guanosine(2251)-2'-O)-methyltransferase RlmB n=1 Tax=unclassified Halomonas TaxID=2609666 RepID=UPI001EF5E981|nr:MULTISPECIES: 23S rRNA (guanosine(2251)-2'-O)-methyltransferase RlmB [unclassified Halomonas]MCG7600685.1 23S rRNA (guanosine(2251)-2'-O)-methyltransferase RlmB [Halomonas sp. McH1-25]MCP1341263.1 23S rRNA (guanosine(2251)-2'-O)-methyltransferase RlmB [Halomonas sp. FL8]MCP1363037.1 23S rRNA (guanosine(2251)-2'-O)-methyltransferase RlmB [Halomonas sp. BBD45]MCP1365835.1 23S rRNA (guanosine(2251)-2'-O)-methyltransferase RlmB [Halomonas sp. BBD48]
MSRNGAARPRHKSPAGRGKSNSTRRSSSVSVPGGLDSVFGVHAVRALLARGEAPRELWIQEGQAGSRLEELVAEARDAGAHLVMQPREVLDELAGEAAHQGVIAFCPPLTVQSEEALMLRLGAWQQSEPPLLLVLDGVTDVHNFGACLRSADAAGAHGVIVPKDKAAPLNATVRKVACGAAESVPVYQVTNLARAMQRLKDAGVWITGTAGEAEAGLFEADFTGACALVMGAEGKGMRRLTREACDGLVKLPMAGSVSSLNVSVATGICLYEIVRQRGLARPATVE